MLLPFNPLNMARYEYSSLKDEEIRLVTLPSRRSGSAGLRLHTVKLPQGVLDHQPKPPPLYEALSYVWGSLEDLTDVDVLVDRRRDVLQHLMGRPSPRPSKASLPITRNLAEALPYFRRLNESRVLWIDAICINQKDVPEKGHQVGRMADIYKLAMRVHVWLGPADSHIKQTLRTLEHLAAQVEVNFTNNELKVVSGADRRFLSNLPYPEAEWNSIGWILQKPWFGRLWVWQEVHANPDNTVVWMGHETIRWNSLRKAVFAMGTAGSVPAAVSKLLSQVFPLCCGLSTTHLVTLLIVTTNSKCGDPRDRVFALLGMLKTGGTLGLVANYEKPVGEIYRDVTLRNLAAERRLEILIYGGFAGKLTDMPSWVPDWTKVSRETSRPFNASLFAPAEARHDGEDVLDVCGVDCGTVASVQSLEGLAGSCDPTTPWKDFVSNVFSLLPLSDLFNGIEAGSGLEILMRTICQDDFREQYKPAAKNQPSSASVKQSLLKWQSHRAMGDSWIAPAVLPSDELYRASVRTFTSGRSMLRTIDGRFGIGPNSILPGDRVCVILGCGLPLALRAVSEDTWVIVGPCYIHGIMDGSALLSACPSNFRPIQQACPSDGAYHPAIVDTSTGRTQINDPRLNEPLPAGWEVIEHKNEQCFQMFKDTETGRATKYDSRLFADALRARGVKLRSFKLV